MYLKWASHAWLYPKISFFLVEFFFGFGWVGGFGRWVRQITPPPAPLIDKHIPNAPPCTRRGLLKLLFPFWRVYEAVLLALAIWGFCLEETVEDMAAIALGLLRQMTQAAEEGTLADAPAAQAYLAAENDVFHDLRLSRTVSAATMLLAMLMSLRFITLSNTFNLLVVTMQISLVPLAFLLAACFLITVAYSCTAFILFGEQVAARCRGCGQLCIPPPDNHGPRGLS